MSDKEAIETLLNSEWFFEEMENGNYHSAYEFMREILPEAPDE